MNLKQTYAPQDAARDVAAGRHESWSAAVAAYLARRKRELLQGISDKPSFDVDKVRHRVRTLPELARILGAELDGGIEPEAEKLIERAPNMSREDHQVQLSYLLTPLGWREKYLPALERRREQAITECIEEDKDSDRNLALAHEIERMIAFLQAVENDAHLAAGRSALVRRETSTPGSLRQAM